MILWVSAYDSTLIFYCHCWKIGIHSLNLWSSFNKASKHARTLEQACLKMLLWNKARAEVAQQAAELHAQNQMLATKHNWTDKLMPNFTAPLIPSQVSVAQEIQCPKCQGKGRGYLVPEQPQLLKSLQCWCRFPNNIFTFSNECSTERIQLRSQDLG